MKGFFIKDCRLLKAQKNLLTIIPIGLLILFTKETPFIGISYTLYVITFLGTSLLAYDSFDNGMAFLMTLPGGRKAYVTEKYVFNFITTSITALFLVMIASALELFRGKDMTVITELIYGTILLFAFATVFYSIMLPIQLKFGNEKSRVVMMIIFGIIFLGTMSVGALAKYLKLNINGALALLDQFSISAVTFLGLAAAMLILILSWSISQKIMKRKCF